MPRKTGETVGIIGLGALAFLLFSELWRAALAWISTEDKSANMGGMKD